MDANVNFQGQANGAGDTLALFRPIYLAEVLSAFNAANITMDKHTTRTIENGKSVKFPATGLATGGYHVPGSEILGRSTLHNEVTISVDEVLYSDSFVSEIDELRNHYDVRGEYSKQQGEFLANTWDRNVLSLMIQAARTTAGIVAGRPGGTVLTNSAYRTDADVLAQGLFDARVALDEKFIPQSDVTCFLRPAQHALLVSGSSKAIHKDYDGRGSYANGSIAVIAGVPIVRTTNLPTFDLSSDAAIAAAGLTPEAILGKYRGDFTNTAAVIAHKSAVATVKLKDLQVEITRDPRRLGTLIVSSMICGAGVLRPETSVELSI